MPAVVNRLVPANGPLPPSQPHGLREPLAVSAGLHFAILILAIMGLPFLHREEPTPPAPISISMVPISDIARTTRQAKPVEQPDDDQDEPSKASQPPTTAAPPPTPPEPPKETPKPAPPPPLPPPPPPKAELPAIEPMKPVPQMQQQILQQMQALPPLQKPMQIIKPQPVAKPPQPPAKQQDQDFDALLKNLSKDQPQADEITHDKPVVRHPRTGSEGMQSNTMTASEQAAISERLKACWVFPAGAYDAENLIVYVDAHFNEDKSLKSVQIDDTARYNSDPSFRAAADAALRAIRNPMCNPLPLPDGKFADWGEINMKFDPKMMMAP